MDLARAEHVDDLEHHKGSEEESPVARGMSREVASCRKCFILNRIASLNLSFKFFPDSSKDFTVLLVGHASCLISRNLSNFREKGCVIEKSLLLIFVVEIRLTVAISISGPGPVVVSSWVDHTSSNSVTSSSYVLLRDEVLSVEGNDKEDDGLPDRVVHNVLDHLAGNEVIILVLRLTLEESRGRRSSSKS